MAEISNLNGYKIKDKKAIRFYDNVESMKNDTTLKNGMYVKTKGYYTINDGGGAEYHITDTSSQEKYQEELNNNLYAELIIDNNSNIMQFGCYGDDVHDDTIALQNAINFLNNVNLLNKILYTTNNITINNDNTHIYNGQIRRESAQTGKCVFIIDADNIDINNVMFKSTNNQTAIIGGTTEIPDNTSSNIYAIYIRTGENINIENCNTDEIYSLLFIGALEVNKVKNIYVNNCNIEKATLPFFTDRAENITISNCNVNLADTISDSRFHAFYISYGTKKVNILNCKISGGSGDVTGIHLFVASGDVETYHEKIEDVFVDNIEYIGFLGKQIFELHYIDKCIINNLRYNQNLNNSQNNIDRLSMISGNCSNITISNCDIKTNDCYRYFYLNYLSADTIQNILFKNNKLTGVIENIILNAKNVTFENNIVDVDPMRFGYNTLFDKSNGNTNALNINLKNNTFILSNKGYFVNLPSDTVESLIEMINNIYIQRGSNSLPNSLFNFGNSNLTVRAINNLFVGASGVVDANTTYIDINNTHENYQ